jgi:lipid A 3-O-deacylase
MKKLLVLFLLMPSFAHAVDGVFVERGKSNNVAMVRFGAVWNWEKSWAYGSDWQVTGAWEATVGGWRGEQPAGNNQVIGDIGITPVFHVSRRDATGIRPYFEGGFLGLHLISRAFIYDTRKFGSAFQFGHHLGFGADFGERHQYMLGFRFQHLSNAGIVQPNQGINFSLIHFAYSF